MIYNEFSLPSTGMDRPTEWKGISQNGSPEEAI